MNDIKKLAAKKALWISFVATVLCSIAFPVVAGQFGITLLDAISDPEQCRAVLATMSDSQRSLHAWITGTLDVVYPAAYGALFVGSAYRFFPSVGRWLAAPILLLVPVDLLEGLVQILALTDTVDWLGAKALLTPAKLVLFYFGLIVTLCGWGVWIVRRFQRQETTP